MLFHTKSFIPLCQNIFISDTHEIRWNAYEKFYIKPLIQRILGTRDVLLPLNPLYPAYYLYVLY